MGQPLRDSFTLIQNEEGTATTSEATTTLPYNGYAWSVTNDGATNDLLFKFHKTAENAITVKPGETIDVDIVAKIFLVEASAATTAYRVTARG